MKYRILLFMILIGSVVFGQYVPAVPDENPIVTLANSGVATKIPTNFGVIPSGKNPVTFYGVAGDTITAYLESMAINYESIHQTDKGSLNSNSWVYEAVEGDTSFKLQRHHYNLEYRLEVVAATAGTGVTRKVIFAGDSGIAPGIVTQNFINSFSADPMNVTVIGTQGVAPNFHEGYGGKTFDWFMNDTASPFNIGGVFDFGQYLIDNGYTMAADDWMIVWLGANDISITQVPGSPPTSTIITNATDFINGIKTAVPGIRIALLMMHSPNLSEAAWIDDYGTNGPTYKSNWLIKALDLNKEFIANFDNEIIPDVFLIPTHCAVDNVNDYSPLNALHSNASGYVKMGKYCYYFVKNKE